MDLYTKVKLNEIGNRLLDLCEAEGVELISNANFSLALIKKGNDYLALEGVHRTDAYKEDRPPMDWDEFLNTATDIFVKKNTDYGSRYTRGLMGTNDPRFLYGWEADKKVDRVRSWVARGELLVKGEGVANSVYDLFNYTVMYSMFKNCLEAGVSPLDYLKENDFYTAAAENTAAEWLDYLETEGIITKDDSEVKAVIGRFMGLK